MYADLRGGLSPVRAWGRIEAQSLKVSGVVLSGDGRQRIYAESESSPAAQEALGEEVAQASSRTRCGGADYRGVPG